MINNYRKIESIDIHICTQLLSVGDVSKPQAPVIEVCPSSNMATLGIKTLGDHPWLSTWLQNNYPIAVCTGEIQTLAI